MKKTLLAAFAATVVATAAQPAFADGRAGAFVRAHAVDLLEGALTRVHVYIKDAAKATVPSDAYVDVIARAYREHGFDERGLTLALEVAQ